MQFTPKTRRWAARTAVVAALCAVAGASAFAQSGEADRFNRIEAQMRALTGQIEDLTYQLRQLQAQLDQLGGGTGTAAIAAPPTAPPRQVGPGAPARQDTIGVLAGQDDTDLPVEIGEPGIGEPPRPLGSLLLDAPTDSASQPLDLSALARGDAGEPLPPPLPADQGFALEPLPQIASVTPTGDPQTDYTRSYDLFVAGSYDAAETSFRQFIDAYPQDRLAADAQYWLGQTYFVRGRYREAAEQFRGGYKAYPQSDIAPYTVFQLGQSLAGLQEREAACQMYAAVLKQYPSLANSLRQRVVNEQASARC
jgi:tol-pal system protein YbgF